MKNKRVRGGGICEFWPFGGFAFGIGASLMKNER
jgi:hypothetical protein